MLGAGGRGDQVSGCGDPACEHLWALGSVSSALDAALDASPNLRPHPMSELPPGPPAWHLLPCAVPACARLPARLQRKLLPALPL